MRTGDLVGWGAPEELVQRWSRWVDDLTDVQERAVRAGVFNGHTNLLVVAPTSSGKTFVGEMAAATAVLRGTRSRALFLVPFKALAEEHCLAFRDRYSDLLVVELATGDHPEVDADIIRGRFNLAVMTYEKLRGFLVQDPRFLDRVATVVIDEVQMLGDSERGPSLEILLTHILRSATPPQLIGLSASLDARSELPDWMRAELVISEMRPVALREGVCGLSGEAIFASDGGTTRLAIIAPQPDRDRQLAQLVADAVAQDQQVLVFVPTVAKTAKHARQLAALLPARGVDPELGAELAELEQTAALRALALTLASGVGFHNSELSFDERSAIERAFRRGAVRVLVSTTTLAMGVNLPCDLVVVSEVERPTRVRHAWLPRRIPLTEYKNAAGRAGRLGQRQSGTALLLAGDPVERDALLREYVLAPADPVGTQLPGRPLGDLVFDLLSSNVGNSGAELLDFVRSTFAYRTFYATERGGGDESVRIAIDGAVKTCLDSGLAEERGSELEPTQAAQVLAASGVSLESAARLARLVSSARASPPPPHEVLFEVCLCRELPAYPFPPEGDPRPFIDTRHWTWRQGSALGSAMAAAMLAEPVPHALVRLAFLDSWIQGIEQEQISRRFAGANGRRALDAARTAAWLLESFARAAQACGVTGEVVSGAIALGQSLRYGVPLAMVPIARLEVQGIGRADLMRILAAGRPELLDIDLLTEADSDLLVGILTASQIHRLHDKIASTLRASLRRSKADHLIRADAAKLPGRIVKELYEARAGGLEEAVRDALAFVGLSAKRVKHQPHGEPDVIVEYGGTVVISVTASDDDAASIRWAKVREVMSAGAGLNPVNCVCVGRPGFQQRAEQAARDIAREQGERRLLLLSIPTLAEMVLRYATGSLSTSAIGEILAHHRGVLTDEMLAAGAG